MPFALASLLAQTSPQAGLERLATDYGIEIRVLRTVLRASRNDYAVVGHPVPSETIARYAPLFEREWRRYPPSLMRRVGLRKIVIAADVRVEGQPRAAVPEFRQGWFWLDATVGSRLPEYGRKTIHHDFFHMIDERDDPEGRQDPAWAALNAPGTTYGSGGWWMQKGDVGALTRERPGFLTVYSTAAVEEDKAEIFSHLLCSPAFVAERVAADPVVATKVARLKAILEAFEPAMDAAWWTADRAR